MAWILLLLFCGQVLSLEIIESSDADILVKEGDPIELFCESDDRYLWCMWIKVEEEKEYQTTSLKEEGEVTEEGQDGFEWVKSRTKCGLRFGSAERSMAGQWKCQLSDTNAEVNMKDERFFQLDVGWEAHHQLTVSGPQAFKLDSPDSEAIQAVEGEEMVMECEVVEEGNPPPQLTLSLETGEGEVVQQAETCEDMEEEVCEETSVRMVVAPGLANEGGVVRCVSQQRGLQQEILYENEVSEEALEVLVAPIILWESSTHLEYQGEELLLEAKFRAKPSPEEGEVRWFVLFPSNDTHLELSSDVKLENADIILEPFSEVDSETHTFLSLLHVSHVSSNLTIEFQIHNSVGKTSGTYQVNLPPPPPPPPTTVPAIIEDYGDEEEYENDETVDDQENIEENEDIKEYEDNEEETSGSGDEETVVILDTDEMVAEYETKEDAVTEGSFLGDGQFLVEDNVKAESMPVGSIIALLGGIIFGLALIFLGFFLCRSKPSQPTNPTEVGSSVHLARVRSKDMTASSNLSPLLVGDSHSLPEDYTFPSPPMTTFGKTNQKASNGNQALNGKASPLAGVLVKKLNPDEGDHHGRDVDELDNLSDLGVGREDPDPLASWEDLEPGLGIRRSRNLEELEIESALFGQTPRSRPPSTVMLSGPTGYPVTIPSPSTLSPNPTTLSPNSANLSPNPRLTPALPPHPPPSPRGSSLQLLQLHLPQ